MEYNEGDDLATFRCSRYVFGTCTIEPKTISPRTNNHIEGWHKGFSGNCDGTHPTVWKLIRAFQRAEIAARTDLHQVLGGHPVVPKKKYADCAARVKNVVDNYPARRADVLGYLRSIAWNFSF